MEYVPIHVFHSGSFGYNFRMSEIAEWSARCGKLFPFSTYFKGAKCSAARLENIQDSNHSENGKVESECEKDHTHSVNGGVRDLVLS